MLGACTWTHFLKENDATSRTSIFFLATILGLGTTIILVMCLSMLSDMVGENTVSLFGACIGFTNTGSSCAKIMLSLLFSCLTLLSYYAGAMMSHRHNL